MRHPHGLRAALAALEGLTFVASNATSNPSGINTAKSITFPATPESGDIILVHTTMGTGVTSEGYTQAGTTFTNSESYKNRAYYKIAGASESASVLYDGTDAIAILIKNTSKSSVAIGSWADTTSATLAVTPPASTTSADIVVITTIDRSINNATDTTTASGYTMIGAGASSSYFSVFGHYLSVGSSSSASFTRVTSANSWTGIAFRVY